MKVSNVSERLSELIKENNYRQVDILEKCEPYFEQYNVKLGRNDLSQYLSGKVEPRYDKLFILSLALNVSEAWLMGFDVPSSTVNIRNLTNKLSLLTELDQLIVLDLVDSILRRKGITSPTPV